MAFVLSFLGWMAILLGGSWAGVTIYANIGAVLQRGGNEPLPSLLALAIATPGLGLVLGGLFLLAAGSALIRLDRIARNTADMLDELQSRPAVGAAPTAVVAPARPVASERPKPKSPADQIEPRL